MNKNFSHHLSREYKPRILRNALIGAAIALTVIGIIVAIKYFQISTMMAAGAKMVMPPEPVNTVVVHEQQWQSRVSSVGSIAAVQGTIISAEAEGIVRTIKFTAGSAVKKEHELVRLDTDLEEAQLRTVLAAAEGTRLTYNRAKELILTGAISKSDFNDANVAVKQADAQVDNIRAMIARKIIRAPFDGKLGIRRISEGQFLNKGDPLVELYSLSPVYAEFSLPQQRLGDLSEGLTVNVTADTYPGQSFEGVITAINPNIDPSTRNVRVQATLTNTDGKLRPGMFVTVDIILAKSENVLLIPLTSVVHATTGNSVFVIEEGEADADGNRPLLIQQQLVTLGMHQGDFVVASKGLTAGQQIVSAGVFKLRPGMLVIIDNTLAPEFKLTPQPDNT